MWGNEVDPAKLHSGASEKRIRLSMPCQFFRLYGLHNLVNLGGFSNFGRLGCVKLGGEDNLVVLAYSPGKTRPSSDLTCPCVTGNNGVAVCQTAERT
jgi:hypothetical protein